MTPNKALHMLIQQFRKDRKLSKSYMAQKLGMSRPTYLQIEKGNRDPTVPEIKTIAQIFGVEPAVFLGVESVVVTHYKVDLPLHSMTKSSAKFSEQEVRISVPQRNLEKFKEVLLYVLEKVGAKPNVGETVLFKLLYFIDFDFYEKYERQLMGATYIKNHYGPTPVEFKAIADEMRAKGELEVVRSQFFQHEQKKYLPLRSPDLSLLSAEEKALIDDVLARLSNKTAKELSDYSHADVPWAVHKMGEKISYETVFYRGHEHSVKNQTDEL